MCRKSPRSSFYIFHKFFIIFHLTNPGGCVILHSAYTSIHTTEAVPMSQNLFAKAYFFGYYYFFGKK